MGHRMLSVVTYATVALVLTIGLALWSAGGHIQLIAILAGYEPPRAGTTGCEYHAWRLDSIPFLRVPDDICSMERR